jgi:hypothetical protein
VWFCVQKHNEVDFETVHCKLMMWSLIYTWILTTGEKGLEDIGMYKNGLAAIGLPPVTSIVMILNKLGATWVYIGHLL